MPGPCSLAPHLTLTAPLRGSPLGGAGPAGKRASAGPYAHGPQAKDAPEGRGGLHRAGLGPRGSPQAPSVRPSAHSGPPALHWRVPHASQQQAQTEPWLSPALAAEGAHPKPALCLRPDFTQMPSAGSRTGPAPPHLPWVRQRHLCPALPAPRTPPCRCLLRWPPCRVTASARRCRLRTCACWGSHFSLQRGHRQGVLSAPTGKMSCSSGTGGQSH